MHESVLCRRATEPRAGLVARSPIDLPLRLRNYLGKQYLERTAAQLDRYGCLAMHFGTGLYIRNFLRSLDFGWTDQELDECWSAVVFAAAGKKIPKFEVAGAEKEPSVQ